MIPLYVKIFTTAASLIVVAGLLIYAAKSGRREEQRGESHLSHHHGQRESHSFDNITKCLICLGEFSKQKLITFPCKHPFCEECTKTILGEQETCPQCRSVIPESFAKKYII